MQTWLCLIPKPICPLNHCITLPHRWTLNSQQSFLPATLLPSNTALPRISHIHPRCFSTQSLCSCHPVSWKCPSTSPYPWPRWFPPTFFPPTYLLRLSAGVTSSGSLSLFNSFPPSPSILSDWGGALLLYLSPSLYPSYCVINFVLLFASSTGPRAAWDHLNHLWPQPVQCLACSRLQVLHHRVGNKENIQSV